MKFAAVATLAATVAYASAADYYWRHDSEWASESNWKNGAAPASDEYAAFGVSTIEGDVEECGNMDALINVPASSTQESGGILIAPGVEISIGVDAELIINEASNSSDAFVQWKCKSDVDIDYRCSANWADENGAAVGGIPCGLDNIHFSAKSFNVNNEGVPIVSEVTIAGETATNSREIEAISDEYVGFARHFIAESTFSSDPITLAAANLACFDSCPDLDTVNDATYKYEQNHKHLQERQEFLALALEGIGDDFVTNPSEQITVQQQAAAFGRETLYVFNGNAGEQREATVRVQQDSSDAKAFCGGVEDDVALHFLSQTSGGACLNPD
eukprot:gene2923-23953_t